jgi:hypothetical protein
MASVANRAKAEERYQAKARFQNDDARRRQSGAISISASSNSMRVAPFPGPPASTSAREAPGAPGCGANRAVLHSRPRQWARHRLRTRLHRDPTNRDPFVGTRVSGPIFPRNAGRAKVNYSLLARPHAGRPHPPEVGRHGIPLSSQSGSGFQILNRLQIADLGSEPAHQA